MNMKSKSASFTSPLGEEGARHVCEAYKVCWREGEGTLVQQEQSLFCTEYPHPPTLRVGPFLSQGERKFRFILFFFMLLMFTTPSFADNTNLLTSAQAHFDKNEFALAQADWQKAADQGDAQALDKLADMYASGIGVPVDYAQALKDWHLAAELGDGEAMFQIAVSYEIARGVARDGYPLKTWFNKALDHCSEDAAAHALVMENADTGKAIACLKKNADAGNYRAMMNLASKNGSGQYVLKNPLESVSWGHIAIDAMQKKADAGDTQAMFFLCRALAAGVGDSIPRDFPRALKSCEKAASLDNVEAMNWLLSTYISNDQYRDYKKASLWNQKIIAHYAARAEKGDVSAMLELTDKYFRPPTEVEQDMGKPIAGAKKEPDKAIAWAKKAASLNSRAALYMLGYIYEDNNHNPVHDCRKARLVYDGAAALGDLSAMERLGARAKGAVMLGCPF
jgi:TPR repeat protein